MSRVKNYTIRPATKEDIEEFNGEPFPLTVRAWAIHDRHGELKAIGGTVRTSPYASLAFMNMKEHDEPDMTVYRAAKEVFEKMKQTASVLIADPTMNPPEIIEGAPRFLESLGFYEVEGVYRWDS